jgi:DNA helicase-2/ATP-dependent DNA helicase PcrA
MPEPHELAVLGNTQLQHQLSVVLSSCVPTTIFGDPMQGIFEFAGATLRWAEEIHQDFPLAGTLDIPYRWVGRNPALGEWITEVREQLMRGGQIDIAAPRISYRESGDAFDMGTLFDGSDGREGSFAAINCNKTICYRLASAANGGYQAIEEVAANRLSQLAGEWDRAADGEERSGPFKAH